jgi:hypothetical protein
MRYFLNFKKESVAFADSLKPLLFTEQFGSSPWTITTPLRRSEGYSAAAVTGY